MDWAETERGSLGYQTKQVFTKTGRKPLQAMAMSAGNVGMSRATSFNAAKVRG